MSTVWSDASLRLFGHDYEVSGQGGLGNGAIGSKADSIKPWHPIGTVRPRLQGVCEDQHPVLPQVDDLSRPNGRFWLT